MHQPYVAFLLLLVFVAANAALDAGDYVVDIVATTRDGRSYESSWPLTIAPAPAR